MLNLNDLRFFVQAIDSGGFAAAGRRLGRPKSTISKRVAELEMRLGVRLVHRTSRSFALTDVGGDFYEHARAAIVEAEAAESVVLRRLAEPSGTVRMTASVPTAQMHLADRLPLLARAFPKLRIDLHVTDRFVDLVHEGFDIAVRSHFAPLPDSDLVRRRLAAEPIVLVAAPDYVAEFGVPEEPEALAVHHGLLTGSGAIVWLLADGQGREVQVAPQARLLADESQVLLKAATAGLGIACLPASMCAFELDNRRLLRMLPSWSAGTVTTTLLTPHRRGQLPSVRAVLDFLSERRD